MKYFGVWLKEQIGRSDPVGDLALDTFDGHNDPPGRSTPVEIQKYMNRYRPCEEAISALHDAVDEYQQAAGLTLGTSNVKQRILDDLVTIEGNYYSSEAASVFLAIDDIINEHLN